MITFAFQLPRGLPRGPVVVVLILGLENMERMKQADPLDCKFTTLPLGLLGERPITDIDLVIAYEEDVAALTEVRRKHDLAGLMMWLQRGRQMRPGDLTQPKRLSDDKVQ
jgi:hypothetical protein